MSEGLAAFLTVPLQSLHYVGSFLYMPLPRQSLSPRQVPDLLSETLNGPTINTAEAVSFTMGVVHSANEAPLVNMDAKMAMAPYDCGVRIW